MISQGMLQLDGVELGASRKEACIRALGDKLKIDTTISMPLELDCKIDSLVIKT